VVLITTAHLTYTVYRYDKSEHEVIELKLKVSTHVFQEHVWWILDHISASDIELFLEQEKSFQNNSVKVLIINIQRISFSYHQ